MRNTLKFAMFIIAACAQIHSATAQTEIKSGIKVTSLDDARCKKNVAQYAETMQFLRQSAGEQLSTKVMSSYVSLEQLSQVVNNSGYCAGEQLLRDKKAVR